MEPVEIEILLKDHLTDGLDKAGLSADQLRRKIQAASEEIVSKIAEQRSVIAGIENDLKKLEAQYGAMKPGTAQTELKAEVDACRMALDEERGALKQLEAQHVQLAEAAKRVMAADKGMAQSAAQAGTQAQTLTERLREQRQVVSQIQRDIGDLKAKYVAASSDKDKKIFGADLDAAKIVLKEEIGVLHSLERQQKSAGSSTVRLTTRMRQLKNEMTLMAQAGRQDTQEYRDLEAQAAKLQQQLNATNKAMKVLSSPNANFQGVVSGINMLTGSLSAGMGIMALFNQENEDLMRIQTKLQAVMSITIGLQQVSSQLLSTSAFRTVTLTRLKNLLTAANARLAVALGISNTAATVLMGTLTLGLSVAITAGIALWNRWSDSQSKAAEAAKKLAETEDYGRAVMLKTRFEIDTTKEALKNFTGSKKEEKAKVDELNRKYGEAMGYYDTVAQWYDVLTQKAEQYIQMLFLQAKAQALVNQAVEADKEVNKLKATPDKDVKGYAGIFTRTMAIVGGLAAGVNPWEMNRAVDASNKQNKALRIKAAKAERDKALQEAKDLQKKYDKIAKTSGLGGHTAPGKTGKTTGNNELKAFAEAQLAARRKIEDNYIALIKDGYEREREEANLNFEREKQRIADEESKREVLYKKLRKAGAKVTPAQEYQIHADAAKQRAQAAEIYAAKLAEIGKKEEEDTARKNEKEKEELDTLLGKYQDYGTQRLNIEKQFAEDVEALNKRRTAGNASEIDAAIVQAAKVRDKQLREVNASEIAEMKTDASLLVELFEDVSGKSVSEIEKIIAKIKLLFRYMDGQRRGLADASGTVVFRDKNGKQTERITKGDIAGIGITPEQYEKLKKSPEALKAFMDRYEKLKKTVLDKNPFKALADAVKELFKKNEDGDKEKSLEEKLINLGKSAAAAADMVGILAGQLSKAFEAAGNDSMAQSMSDVQDVMSAVSNIGKGFAQGGVVGGIAVVAGEAIGFITKAFSASARHKAALKAVMNETIAQQREYNLLLMQQNLEYERGTTIFGTDSYGKAHNAIKVMKQAVEELNAALHGSGKSDTGYFKALGARIDIYSASRRKMADAYAGLADISIVTGHKKTGLFGWGKGKDLYSSVLTVYPQLISANGEFNVSLAETIVSTRRMSDEHKAALQNMINLAKKQKEAWEEVKSYLTNVFGEFGSTISDVLEDAFRNGTDAGKNFVDKMGSLLEKLGKDMIYSVTIAPYIEQAQKKMLEVMKNDSLGSEAKFDSYVRILDSLTAGVLSDQGRYEELMKRFKEIAAKKGIDIFGAGKASQSGKSGSFETMTQQQGTKLEGLFTSGQRHWASMDVRLEDVASRMTSVAGCLTKIEENTSHCKRLDEIAQDIHALKKDGFHLR